MTTLKSIYFVLTLSYILITLINPSQGISVSYGANGVSSSSNYHLDTSTTLNDMATLGAGTLSRTSQVSGSGDNEYSIKTSAKGSIAESAVKSNGRISANTLTTASGEVAGLSQGVAGSGDLKVTLSGSSGSAAAEQNAGVANGVLSTSQSLATGSDRVVAGQNTQMRGDAATVESRALSEKNYMASKGGFSGGDVDLNAKLISASDDRAMVDGRVSVAGIQCMGDGDFKKLANAESDGAIISTNGLVLDKDEDLVDYGFSFANMNIKPENTVGYGTLIGQSSPSRAGFGCAPRSIGPSDREQTIAGGDPNNYVLFSEISNLYYPGSWPDDLYPTFRIDETMQFSLQIDDNLRSTGLNPRKVLSQADLALGTWDRWTSKQLFKRTIPSTNSAVDAWDGKNVIGFYGFDYPGVASTTVYVTISGSDLFVTESDISFSQRIWPGYLGPDWGGWTTDYATANDRNNQKADFQTILLHELGHTIGLADLYLLPDDDPRHGNREIMNGGDLWADHIAQHNLGKGDITGLRRIYGDTPINWG